MTSRRCRANRFRRSWTGQRSRPRLLDKHMGLYLGPEGTPYQGGYLLHNLTLFGRVCKILGMDVTPRCIIDAARALDLIDLGRRGDVYHTLRALFVSRQADLDLFDEAFRTFWRKPVEEW